MSAMKTTTSKTREQMGRERVEAGEFDYENTVHAMLVRELRNGTRAATILNALKDAWEEVTTVEGEQVDDALPVAVALEEALYQVAAAEGEFGEEDEEEGE